MKTKLHSALIHACQKLAIGAGNIDLSPSTHADITCNVALKIASKCHMTPETCAQTLLSNIKLPDGLSASVSKEGFINFFYSDALKTKFIIELMNKTLPVFEASGVLDDAPHAARMKAWAISLGRLGCSASLAFGQTSLDKPVANQDILQFFYVSVPAHVDLHLSASTMTAELLTNPWYAIKYALSRNKRVIDGLCQQGIMSVDCINHDQWPLYSEDLLQQVMQFEWLLEQVSLSGEVFHLHGYAKNLARTIHYYYNRVTLLSTNPVVCSANLMLLQAAQRVLTNSLKLLGVNVE